MKQNGIKIITLFLWVTFSQLKAQVVSQSVEKDIRLFSVYLSTNSDSAYHYIQRAYKKSLVLKNDSLIARSLYNLGYYHYLKNNTVESKKLLNKALNYSNQCKFYKISALSYNQLGTIAFDENQFEVALSRYLKALEIADRNKIAESKSRVLINLGNLYLRQKDTLKSLIYYNQNISNAEKNQLYNELIKGYMNCAVLFSENDLQKSIQYYNKALSLSQHYKDLYSEFNLHINLSELYLSGKKPNELVKVYDHLLRAKKLQLQLNDDSLLFYLNFNFGGYFRKEKQFDKALEYYKMALRQSKKNVNSDQLLNLYKTLSETYLLKEDFKNALLFKNMQYNLSDSIFTEKKNRDFNEIQTKYEVDKKNLKIQLLTKEKIIEKDRKKWVFLVNLLIIIALFSALLFFRNRIKTQKIILAKENEIHKQEVIRLEQEKELKRIVGLVEGQDQERNRLAKEMHDGIGGALAGIKLELSQCNAELKSKKIDSVITKMAEAFTDLRMISHNLSLNSLKNKDLNKLLMDLKNDYENRSELMVEIVVFPPDSINQIKETVKHQIYRVVQELLTNVSKHAKAKTVFLNLTMHEDFLNIIVEDNGCGFNSNDSQGIGLSNITERLSTIEAVLNIESAVGKGTTVTIDIPISQL
ncbi:MAG: sensor histidine kinase [Flavobacterium sp.]|nr:sensor histidine kinase [Flavobacterium sp.]